MSFRLAPDQSAETLARQYAEHGYVQVRPVLEPESAATVAQALATGTDWNLVFNQGSKHFDMADAQARELTAEDRDRLEAAIYAQARDGFQYYYNNYPIYDAYRAGRDQGHVLHRFHEWVNSAEFLDFARTVTGSADITFADSQATRYLPGHFLTRHDDTSEGKHRRAAYIFNFSERWRPDWGGYLYLLTEDGDIRHGLMPAFNALNIIAVPQPHCVSLVAPFAGTARLSVTGWLRAGEET